MRIILDECLPARLRRELPGHEVDTVPHAGWASVKNGRLLRLIAASGRYDVFLTMDKNLPQQQHLQNLPFAIVVFRADTNAIGNVRPLLPELLQRLHEFLPGQVYFLSSP